MTRRNFAIVTGASSGIGYELAKQCLEHGFEVLAVAEDPGLESALGTLAEAGGAVTGLRVDLSTREGCENLARLVEDVHVDALILNAGTGVWGPFVETNLEAELRMISLNICHTVVLAKLIVPEMVRRGHGRILITGSVASTAPNPFLAVYGGTKAFLLNFGEALRYELKDTGVTVTVLQPNATETHFFERAGMENTPVAKSDKDDPAVVAKQGFDAMMAGKDSKYGGSLKSRALGLLNEVLPERAKAAQAGRQTRPVTKH